MVRFDDKSIEVSKGMSTSVALPQDLSRSKRLAWLSERFSKSKMKLLLAFFFSAAGLYGIFSDSEYISTSDAVISAYTLDVRTPVEGTLSDLPIAAGGIVAKGQVLARVENPLFDQRSYDDLAAQRVRAESSVAALERERGMLQAEKRQLEARTGKYLVMVTNRMNDQIHVAERSLGALKNSLDQSQIDLKRGAGLHDAGIMADADYEKLLLNRNVLAEQVKEAEADLAVNNTEAYAAGHGILSEPGTNNDVAYSQQRVDEIAILLAANARQLATAHAEATEAENAMARESARNNSLAEYQISSPLTGQIWRLNSINDEHVEAGTSVVTLIDCSRQFVLVEISQDRMADIEVGRTAWMRITGEKEERESQVLSIQSDPQMDFDHKLAALPYREPNQKLASVVLSLAQDGAGQELGCAAGRGVHVRIPVRQNSYFSRTVRRIF